MTWPTRKLGEVADINPSKSEVSNVALGTAVSFVSMASISEQSGAIVNFEDRKIEDVKKGYTYFANNDVLFAKITPCMENGKIALAKDLTNNVGFGTTEVHVIRAKDEILPEWIYSIIGQQSFRDEAQKHMTGSAGQQRVPKDFLENVQIPIPPKVHQKKIVERLDAVRKAQELCDTQIQKTEELFESTLEIELDIKNDWEIKKLNDICDVRDGTHDSPKYQPLGIPLITSKNLKDNEIDFTNVNYISEADYKNIIKRSFVEEGDILYGMIGTIGNPVIVDTSEVFSIKNVCLIKFNKGSINNHYIKFFLQSKKLNNQIIRMSRGGTQKFVSLGNLRSLEIPVPSIQRQQKIVEKLDAVQDYKKLLLKQKSLLKELFDSVLYKSMNGEMDN